MISTNAFYCQNHPPYHNTRWRIVVLNMTEGLLKVMSAHQHGYVSTSAWSGATSSSLDPNDEESDVGLLWLEELARRLHIGNEISTGEINMGRHVHPQLPRFVGRGVFHSYSHPRTSPTTCTTTTTIRCCYDYPFLSIAVASLAHLRWRIRPRGLVRRRGCGGDRDRHYNYVSIASNACPLTKTIRAGNGLNVFGLCVDHKLKRITHIRVGRSGLSRHVAGKRLGVEVARESQDRSEFVGNI